MNYYKDQLSKIAGNDLGFPAQVKLTKNNKKTNWLSLNDESATALVEWLRENYIITDSNPTFGGNWCLQDIIEHAEDIELSLSHKEAVEVMNDIVNNHDAAVGINWGVIGSAIELFVKNRKQSI